MTLAIPTDGPCAGHPCDDCATCRRGRCCRRDNPHYRLPDQGDWDGPIHGAIGVLERSSDRVQCHCCGAYFRALSSHIWFKHNLTAAEYKALFGLRRQRGLWTDELHARQSRISRALFERHPLPPPTFTPEQRSAWMLGSHRTAETARGPSPRTCAVCGAVFRHPNLRRTTCSAACSHRALGRPARRDGAHPLAHHTAGV